MNDNVVIRHLIAAMRTGLDSLGMQSVKIKQGYQRRQGITETGPTVYLHKVIAARVGFQSRKDVFNPANNNFDHTETIWRAPTWQVDGLSTQDPSSLIQLTASDIVEATADVLQLASTRETLLRNNIGIQRITTVRQDYFLNDRERHQQRPSFDFVLVYRHEIRSTVPQVTDSRCLINRV